MTPSTAAGADVLPILTDGVATLRPFRPGDTAAIIEYGNDPELARWCGFPKLYTWADAEAWQAEAAVGPSGSGRHQFAIEVAGRMVGEINLRRRGSGLAQVGFGLVAAARGLGLSTRALRLVLPWSFEQAGVEVVHWQAQVGNWPSRRAAWAVGFRIGDPLPGLLAVNGQRVNGWLGTLRCTDRLQPAHPWFDPVPVTGQNLVLRAHRPDDVLRTVEACRDTITQRWLTLLPADYTEAHAHEHLDHLRTGQSAGRGIWWAIADPDTDHLLGEVAIFLRDHHDPHGEIGYWAHPDARGRGVMTEAVQLAVRHALLPAVDGGLGLPRLLLIAAEGNLASQRVARQAGFTPTGRDRSALLLRDGSRQDFLRFDLLATELPAVR